MDLSRNFKKEDTRMCTVPKVAYHFVLVASFQFGIGLFYVVNTYAYVVKSVVVFCDGAGWMIWFEQLYGCGARSFAHKRDSHADFFVFANRITFDM